MTALDVTPARASGERAARGAQGRHLTGPRLAAPFLMGVLALVAGGCSSCDDGADLSSWRTTYISAAEAADGGGPAAPVTASRCDVEANAAARATAGAPGVVVDPDLVEIAKLEIERDCYRLAEQGLRQRLQTLQHSSVGLK